MQVDTYWIALIYVKSTYQASIIFPRADTVLKAFVVLLDQLSISTIFRQLHGKPKASQFRGASNCASK